MKLDLIKVRVRCAYIMLYAFLLFGCHKEIEDFNPPARLVRNTVVIYMVGENSLSDYVAKDSIEIANGLALLPDSTRVVLYIDDTESSRLLVGERNKALRVVKTYDRDICSTDSADMELVLHDIFDTYPSRHYGLVFWSHASGWAPDRQQAPRRRTFGIDNNRRNRVSDIGTKMEIPTMARVLAHHPHTDYIYFDACFMQCIEVAYELRHVTDYVMGSPAEIPADGAPYSLMMNLLASSGEDVLEALQVIYDYYTTGEGHDKGIELSAIRTSALEQLASATRPIVQELFSGRIELDCDEVQRYFPHSGSIIYPDYYDMVNLFYQHLTTDEFLQWREHFVKAVPLTLLSPSWYSAFERRRQTVSDPDHCGGVSIFVPDEYYDGYMLVNAYHLFEWYTAAGLSTTGW